MSDVNYMYGDFNPKDYLALDRWFMVRERLVNAVLPFAASIDDAIIQAKKVEAYLNSE